MSKCHRLPVSNTDSMCLPQIICIFHRHSVLVTYSLCMSEKTFFCQRKYVSVTNSLWINVTRIGIYLPDFPVWSAAAAPNLPHSVSLASGEGRWQVLEQCIAIKQCSVVLCSSVHCTAMTCSDRQRQYTSHQIKTGWPARYWSCLLKPSVLYSKLETAQQGQLCSDLQKG